MEQYKFYKVECKLRNEEYEFNGWFTLDAYCETMEEAEQSIKNWKEKENSDKWMFRITSNEHIYKVEKTYE